MRKLVLAAIAAAGFTTMGPVLFGCALYGTAMAQAGRSRRSAVRR